MQVRPKPSGPPQLVKEELREALLQEIIGEATATGVQSDEPLDHHAAPVSSVSEATDTDSGFRQLPKTCPPIWTKASEISLAKHRISDHRVTSSSVILLCLSLLSHTVSVLSPNVQYIPFL